MPGIEDGERKGEREKRISRLFLSLSLQLYE